MVYCSEVMSTEEASVSPSDLLPDAAAAASADAPPPEGFNIDPHLLSAETIQVRKHRTVCQLVRRLLYVSISHSFLPVQRETWFPPMRFTCMGVPSKC